MGKQMLSIVDIHIASAFFNGKQVIAAKDMVTMFTTTKRRFWTRIKLNLFVELFYINKEYGMTCDKFGLISRFPFFEVSSKPIPIYIMYYIIIIFHYKLAWKHFNFVLFYSTFSVCLGFRLLT